MQIDRAEVNVGFTANVGNYESLRTDVSLGGTLEPGEDHEEATRELYRQTEAQLVELARELNESMTKGARSKTQISPE